MRRYALALALAFASLPAISLFTGVSTANAQHLTFANNPCTSVACSAIGNGIDFSTNEALFGAVGSMATQKAPFGVAYWVFPNAQLIVDGPAFMDFVNNRGPSANQTGWEAYWRTTSDAFTIKFALTQDGTAFCTNTAQVCARNTLLVPGQWNHVCIGYSSNSVFEAINGYVWDQHNTISTFLPNTSYLSLAGSGNSNIKMRDIRIRSGTTFTPRDCLQLYTAGVGGQMPTAGALATPLYAWWPLNNCTGSGLTLHCADSSGHGRDVGVDQPPVCSITAPTGTVSGTQNTAATCSDSIGVSSVKWSVDGVSIGTSTTGPTWSVAWNTTTVTDAPHALSLVATNVGGNTGTASSTVTTNNGVTGKTVFLDPTTTNDCPTNNGLSQAAPCKTWAGVQNVVQNLKIRAGDFILQKAGTNANIPDLTTASTLTLAGPGCAPNNTHSPPEFLCGYFQNTFPSNVAPITIGTYGGTGQCNILSGITTDCASITLTGNALQPRNAGALNFYNVPNMVIQNFRIFGSQSNAIHCPDGGTDACNVGIKYGGLSSFVTGPVIIQNNEVVDFWDQLYVAGLANPGFISGGQGQLCGGLVQNNYLHGLTLTSPNSLGVSAQNTSCADGSTSLTVTGNYTKFQGGLGSQHYVGNGIIVSTTAGYVDTNNVSTAVDGSLDACVDSGGGAGNWQFQSRIFIMKGNESYNHFPPPPGHASCGTDSDAFDFDNGISQGVAEFNYAHNTMGAAFGFFSEDKGADFPMGPNTASYNLFENGGQSGDGTGSFTGVGAGQHGTAALVNNVIWNGHQGLPLYSNPAQNNQIYAFGFDGGCPFRGLFTNNILAGGNNMITGGFNFSGQHCVITYSNNDYYGYVANDIKFRAVQGSGFTEVGLAAWKARSGEVTATNTLPNFVSPGHDVLCYSGTGIPPPVYTGNCPNGYHLQTGNTMIGTGLDMTVPPWSTTYAIVLPPNDYYQVAIPNGVGTGYNPGADGAHH